MTSTLMEGKLKDLKMTMISPVTNNKETKSPQQWGVQSGIVI